MSATAEELLGEIAAGRMPAMQAFYKQFESTVYRYALSRLNDPHDAGDTLNEVMLEVWRKAGSFEGRSKVSTWLLGITRYKVLDRLRARGRHDTEELDEDIHDDTPNMEQVLAGAQDAEAVRRCMQGLKPNHHEVIHLAFFEDLGYDEIAELVGCPAGTVKSRVHHAKEALKRCLARVMS